MRGEGTAANIRGGIKDFHNPKPKLLSHLMVTSAQAEEDLVLIFRGLCTTAHAVLELNREDGGSRRFILVECEDYADSITAERVRRVIKGVPTAKDEALKKGLGGTFSLLRTGETH